MDVIDQALKGFGKPEKKDVISQAISDLKIQEKPTDVISQAISGYEPPKEEPFLKQYYRWLHTETEPPKSVYDYLTRIIPKSTSATTVGLAEFLYYGTKSFSDPMYEFTKDLVIRGKPIGQAAKERGLQLGKGILDMALGFGEFMGEPVGVYGWERMKKRWLTDPAGVALVVAPFLKALPGAIKTAKAPKIPTATFERARGVRGQLQKVYDWMDVQAPLIRAGAESTSVSVKNFPAVKIFETEKALDVAKKVRKLDLGDKPRIDVTLRAANSIPESAVPKNACG